MEKNIKSGYISLIGRPNVGKSSLMNAVLGEKISIVSDKPQTTRNQLRGIYHDEDSQIVFVDTPGIQTPKNRFGEYMLQSSKESIKNTDLVVYIVDESSYIGKQDRSIIEILKSQNREVILLINKIDLLSEAEILERIELYAKEDFFKEIIPISAKKKKNVQRFLQVLKSYLTEGPKYFPDHMSTDQTESQMISELIREKLLQYLDQEIPHGIMVEVTQMKWDEPKRLMRIHGTIFCERESHKRIIIGAGGRKIKGVGIAARKELELIYNAQVDLQLWVKVKDRWRERGSDIEQFGFRLKE